MPLWVANIIRRLDHERGVPLSERKLDRFFVVAFSAFICTSIITDSVNGLNGALDPNSGYWVERYIYDTYARLADPLLILNPPQVRVSAWISAFVWLPTYVVFVAGFVRGWNWIRPLGLVYGGALAHGMVTYMSEGIFGRMAQTGWADAAICAGCTEPNTLYYLAANSMYLIVPALMIVRMWRDEPFGSLMPVPAEEILPSEPIMIDLRSDETAVELGELSKESSPQIRSSAEDSS